MNYSRIEIPLPIETKSPPLTINWTIVELKSDINLFDAEGSLTINWTIVELKYYKVYKNENNSKLLIEL